MILDAGHKGRSLRLTQRAYRNRLTVGMTGLTEPEPQRRISMHPCETPARMYLPTTA